MGLKINRRIENEKTGILDSFYLRIEVLRVEKFSGNLYYNLTLYPTKEDADNSTDGSTENAITGEIFLDGTLLEFPLFEKLAMTVEEPTDSGIKNRIDTSISGPNLYAWTYSKLKERCQLVFGQGSVENY